MSAEELRLMAVEIARLQKQRDDLAELVRDIAAHNHVAIRTDALRRLEAILRGDA